MKIRKGFVSNSSSSSFVCDVCGEEVSGMDMGLSDAEMCECVGGHTFCEEHMKESYEDITKDMIMGDDSDFIKDMTDDEFEDWKHSEMRYECPESICPICNLTSMTQDMMVDYIVKKTGFTRSDMFKIIKEENKRRRKLYLYEYLEYVERKMKVLKTDILSEVKSNFNTYNDLYEYIYG